MQIFPGRPNILFQETDLTALALMLKISIYLLIKVVLTFKWEFVSGFFNAC